MQKKFTLIDGIVNELYFEYRLDDKDQVRKMLNYEINKLTDRAIRDVNSGYYKSYSENQILRAGSILDRYFRMKANTYYIERDSKGGLHTYKIKKNGKQAKSS